MARPVYLYELSDPDFSWLANSFRENNPDYLVVEQDSLPLIFVSIKPDISVQSKESNLDRENTKGE